MGWSRGTYVFDQVVGDLLTTSGIDDYDFNRIVYNLLLVLEELDWDNVQESDYYDSPKVKDVIREMHPSWFEDEDD